MFNGLAGTKSSLGVIPAGSGNDFSRTIHAKADIDAIIEGTISNSSMPVDIVRLNNRYFLNVSSIDLTPKLLIPPTGSRQKPLCPAVFRTTWEYC